MYDLPRVMVDIQSRYTDIKFNLYHNVNIISGASGIGKSFMVMSIVEIQENSQNENLKVKGYNSKGVLVDYTVEVYTTNSIIKSATGCQLILIDEPSYRGICDLISEKIRVEQDVLFLIIVRDADEELESLNNASGAYPCFASAVYSEKVVSEGNKSIFRLKSVLGDFLVEDLSEVPYRGKVESCIIEGSKTGSENLFYSNLFRNVVCANGKSNVKSYISTAKDWTVIIVDMRAFGSELLDFLNELSKVNVKHLYLMDIPSFEFAICEYFKNTGSLGYDISTILSDCIDGKLFEEYFSQMLVNVKYGSMSCGVFLKNRIPKSLQFECSDCCKIPEKYRCDCNLYGTTLYDRISSICMESCLTEVLNIAEGGVADA
jgi:hypothetical protein